jgi:4-hydroxy-tetrahydrodipicolinate synthase
MTQKLSGCYATMVTPFRDDGELDESSTRRLVDYMIERGVEGIIPLGSVGEFYTLSFDESTRLMRIVAEQIGGRVKLGFGAAHTSTAVVCELTKYGEELGGDFALVLPPYYGHRTSKMIYHHFYEIAQSTTMEVMMYDGGGGIEIPLEVMQRLVEDCDNINHAKFSTPSVEKMSALIAATDGQCGCFVGVPPLTLLMFVHGALGVSGGLPQIIPAEMVSLVSSALSGDLATARTQFYGKLLPLAGFIAAPHIKLLLAWEGIISSPRLRMPLQPLGNLTRREMEAAARLVGLRLPLVEKFQ